MSILTRYLTESEAGTVAHALQDAGWDVGPREVGGYVSNVIQHIATGRPDEQQQLLAVIEQALDARYGERECLRCGHTWQPKVARPVRCPSCQSTAWGRPRQER